jgi:hypothetical protein
MKYIILLFLLAGVVSGYGQKVPRIKTVPDVCDSTLFTYEIKSTVSTGFSISYNWRRPAVPGITNPSSSGNTTLIREHLKNTTNNPVTVNYIITQTLDNGCSHSDTLRVRINPTPRVENTQSLQLCDSSILTFNPTSLVSPTSFSWTRPTIAGIKTPGSTGNTGSISERIENTSGKIIKVPYYIESKSSGCVGYDTVWTNVIPRPYGSIVLTPKDTIKSGKIVSLHFESQDTIRYMYKWEFGDRLSANTYLNPVEHFYNEMTSKDVIIKAQITNRFGCIDTFINKIHVVGDPTPRPIDTMAISKNYSMVIFPVPFEGQLRLKYSLRGVDERGQYIVNDLAGRLIYNQPIMLPAGDIVITLPSEKLEKGVVYVIRVKSKSFDYEDKAYRK